MLGAVMMFVAFYYYYADVIMLIVVMLLFLSISLITRLACGDSKVIEQSTHDFKPRV
jgi:hypothetical protein